MPGVKYYFILILLFCCLAFGYGQPTATYTAEPDSSSFKAAPSGNFTAFVIGEIFIEGNRHTKPYIIKRELPFQEGDSIYLPELVKRFDIGRKQLMNTALFNDVVIALMSFHGYVVDISIKVKERWYVFPIPHVKPVDRNLAEWSKQGYGVDRLNFGFKFSYYNFTGRKDKLKMWLITGYTRQIEFQYDRPYFDKKLKHGYKLGFSYSFNKEINYNTESDQQRFTDSLSGISRWYGNIDYTYRPGLRTFHSARIAFTQLQVDSQVLALNPKYFNTTNNKVSFPEISYTLNYYDVDYIPYPLTGWMGELMMMKRGINHNMNMWSFSGKMTRSWELSKKTYFSWQGYGVLRVPFDQPFINQRLFGYSDLYLRGLENYVIDGVAAMMVRNTFRREIFQFSIPTYIRSKSHDRIPFKFYYKIFSDVGYGYNKNMPQNSLTNRMLYTGGIGIDVVTFYDFILRFDYSFNQLGQKGLFLHVKNDF